MLDLLLGTLFPARRIQDAQCHEDTASYRSKFNPLPCERGQTLMGTNMALIQTTQKQTRGLASELRIGGYARSQVVVNLRVSGRLLSGACADRFESSAYFRWAAFRSSTRLYCVANAMRMPRRSGRSDSADSRCELVGDAGSSTGKAWVASLKVRTVLPSLSTA
jgi:hypothetical protein